AFVRRRERRRRDEHGGQGHEHEHLARPLSSLFTERGEDPGANERGIFVVDVPRLAQRARSVFQKLVAHRNPLRSSSSRSLRFAWKRRVRTVPSGTPTMSATSREVRSSTSQSTKATR